MTSPMLGRLGKTLLPQDITLDGLVHNQMMSPSPINSCSTKDVESSSTRRRRRDGCTECRRKKVKCDLHKPVCSRCKRYPKECSYNLSIIAQTPAKSRVSRRTPELFNHSKELTQYVNHVASALLHQPQVNISPLLFSGESKFLMHIFSTQTANMLFPAAPSFFLQQMIGAALETPHLLYALLASACSHHSRLVQDFSPRPKVTCLKYTNLAISSLRESLSDTNQTLTAQTVTSAMALCTNDVCDGNMHVWRTHLEGVLRLLVTFLENEKRSTAMNDPFVEGLVKWFQTMDIIAALSGSDRECLHDPNNGGLNGTLTSSSGDIDEICGYSLDLVPLMAQISQIIRRRNIQANDADLDEVTSLEMRILALADRTVPNMTPSKGGVSSAELQSTHRAFVHSALLHLHCRIQLLPKSHIKVRTDIKNILQAIRQISALSSLNVLVLWPVFSAGCETDEIDERDTIEERMRKMQSLGMGNFTRARELLHKFWASNSPLPWDAYYSQHGCELVLF